MGVKKEGSPPHNNVDIPQQASAVGPILAKGCTRVLGRVYESVRCAKKNNWPEVNKGPEVLSYISDLNHFFTMPLLRQDARILSLWLYLSALLLS